MRSPRTLLLMAALALAGSGCAVRGTSPAVVRTPPPAALPPSLPAASLDRSIRPDHSEREASSNQPADALRGAPIPRASELLLYALSMLGVKYRYGGDSYESGFDCSGFVRHVFATAAAMELPRSAKDMSKVGDEVPLPDLSPGDLVFYNTLGRRFSHVGIYIGDGRFVHAPSRRKSVEVVNMNDNYWKRRFNGARRLLADADQKAVDADFDKRKQKEARANPDSQ